MPVLEFRKFVFRWRGGLLVPLVLVLLWLARPTPASLFAGALLTLMGEGLRFWSVGFAGEPTRKQELDAPVLVTGGPFSLTRNPLYLGNILNGMGVAVASAGGHGTWQALGLLLYAACGLALVYGSIIPLEEGFLLEQFGSDYDHYRKCVPALLPKSLVPRSGTGSFEPSRALKFERSSLAWLVLIWALLTMKI